jgi:inner membrane protein
MPTVLTHPAVPFALAVALGHRAVSPRLLVAGTVASVIPDLDVIGFRFDIAYADVAGHRGMTHSLTFAVILGIAAAASHRSLRASVLIAFLFVGISAASHGLLDMLTNGGLGVAEWWPFTDERFFFSHRVIEVSPLSIRRVFGEAGARVFGSELLWVWLPGAIIAAMGFAVRRARAR